MKSRIITAFLCFAVIFSGCGKNETRVDDDTAHTDNEKNLEPQPEPGTILIPLDYDTLEGRWELSYSGNFGYEFRFSRNYRATVIIFLSNQALVFRGVYKIEDDNKVRINIVEMKSSQGMADVYYSSGFVKSNASYFLMKCALSEKGRVRFLAIRPQTVMIDGQNSDGYFEPVMRLKRS